MANAAAQLRAIKTAWRNRVAHIDKKHTREEALAILNATKGFMEFLAESGEL